MLNKYIGLGIIILAIVLVAAYSYAAMLKVELPKLTQEAEIIVIGKVVNLNSQLPDKPDSTIFTDVTIEVQQVLKGELASEKTVLVKIYGGEIPEANIGLKVSEEPELKPEQTVIAFLKKEDNKFRPVELIRGVYHIEDNIVIENDLALGEFINQIKSLVK